MKIILASASPRRAKILKQLGLDFTMAPSHVEEVLYPGDPGKTVKENAFRKWAWCVERYPEAAIIAADTLVELEGRMLGKPESIDDAFAMLRATSGRMQTVYTGYLLSRPGETSPSPSVETSKVFFHALSDERIDRYLRDIEPLDRAGAYDIDCQAEDIIERYEGSYTNIMGLPEERVREWVACSLAQ